MRYFGYFLNYLLIISNHLLKKNLNEKNAKKPKKSIFIELCPTVNLQLTFNVLIASILNKKFNIIFFYFGSKSINLTSYFLRFFLKKNNFEIINLNNNLNIKKKIKKFKSKSQLINHKYKNYKIGKYIHQSYSRLFLKTTVNFNDEKLYYLTKLSHARIDLLEKIFKERNIKYVLTSHVVFVNYGMIALVARKYRAKTKIIWSHNNYSKIRTLSIDNKHLLQIDKYYNYRKEFKKIKNKNKCLKLSHRELKGRIFKNLTNYRVSNVSSFSKDNILKIKSKKPKVIILPACFYDANNFFRHKLFFEVYDWLDFTLSHASKTKFDWYVKPHPTNIPMNFEIFEKFKKKYPKINFLKPNTSNLTFKKNNFSSMFTFHSTAAHEFAYMNIPTVVVSDNIGADYNFAKPVKSINSYKALIYNAHKIKNKINLKDVLEFNYMFRFARSSSFVYHKLDNFEDNRPNNFQSLKYSWKLMQKNNKNLLYNRNLNLAVKEIFT